MEAVFFGIKFADFVFVGILFALLFFFLVVLPKRNKHMTASDLVPVDTIEDCQEFHRDVIRKSDKHMYCPVCDSLYKLERN
jgi:TRAP-type uncharacterized transport system fused permease subunit